MEPQRTRLQVDCDTLDCDLYRLIGRAERLAAEHKSDRNVRKKLVAAAAAMASARPEIRSLMHEFDVAQTI
jgi:hypothetical protein